MLLTIYHGASYKRFGNFRLGAWFAQAQQNQILSIQVRGQEVGRQDESRSSACCAAVLCDLGRVACPLWALDSQLENVVEKRHKKREAFFLIL